MIYLILLLTSLILLFFVTSTSYALTNAIALILGLALSYSFFMQKYSVGVSVQKEMDRRLEFICSNAINFSSFFKQHLKAGMIIVRTGSRLQMLPAKVYFDPAKNRRVM